MNYNIISKNVAQDFLGYIMSFDINNKLSEAELINDIEAYGCSFKNPSLHLINASIRCTMDKCGLDIRQIEDIFNNPSDYGMSFGPFPESDINNFIKSPNIGLYDPYVYEFNEMQYISFSPVEVIGTNGIINSSKEYNLVYCCDTDSWTGDAIKMGEWVGVTSDEAASIAEKYKLTGVVDNLKSQLSSQKPSLHDEYQNARDGANELNESIQEDRQPFSKHDR